MYQRGDSGQNQMPKRRGTTGMKEEPSSSLQAFFPAPCNAKLAQKPRKIPNATHICQHITSPPRIEAGAFSAAKTGTVDALDPIPIPSNKRQMNNCSQFGAKPEPMTGRKQKMALKKIVPR